MLDEDHSKGESIWEIWNLSPSERIRNLMASQSFWNIYRKETGKLNSVKPHVSQTLTTEPFHSHRKSINNTINL